MLFVSLPPFFAAFVVVVVSLAAVVATVASLSLFCVVVALLAFVVAAHADAVADVMLVLALSLKQTLCKGQER